MKITDYAPKNFRKEFTELFKMYEFKVSFKVLEN